MSKVHGYDLIPRYSAGSPAWVHEEALARRVADDERRGYQMALEGARGDEARQRAQQEGLDGIVIELRNSSYVDLITGRDYEHMPYAAIREYERVHMRVVGNRALFFFRRAALCELRHNKVQDRYHMDVIRALHVRHGIDPYGLYAAQLWNERRTV